MRALGVGLEPFLRIPTTCSYKHIDCFYREKSVCEIGEFDSNC